MEDVVVPMAEEAGLPVVPETVILSPWGEEGGGRFKEDRPLDGQQESSVPGVEPPPPYRCDDGVLDVANLAAMLDAAAVPGNRVGDSSNLVHERVNQILRELQKLKTTHPSDEITADLLLQSLSPLRTRRNEEYFGGGNLMLRKHGVLGELLDAQHGPDACLPGQHAVLLALGRAMQQWPVPARRRAKRAGSVGSNSGSGAPAGDHGAVVWYHDELGSDLAFLRERENILAQEPPGPNPATVLRSTTGEELPPLAPWQRRRYLLVDADPALKRRLELKKEERIRQTCPPAYDEREYLRVVQERTTTTRSREHGQEVEEEVLDEEDHTGAVVLNSSLIGVPPRYSEFGEAVEGGQEILPEQTGYGEEEVPFPVSPILGGRRSRGLSRLSVRSRYSAGVQTGEELMLGGTTGAAGTTSGGRASGGGRPSTPFQDLEVPRKSVIFYGEDQRREAVPAQARTEDAFGRVSPIHTRDEEVRRGAPAMPSPPAPFSVDSALNRGFRISADRARRGANGTPNTPFALQSGGRPAVGGALEEVSFGQGSLFDRQDDDLQQEVVDHHVPGTAGSFGDQFGSANQVVGQHPRRVTPPTVGDCRRPVDEDMPSPIKSPRFDPDPLNAPADRIQTPAIARMLNNMDSSARFENRLSEAGCVDFAERARRASAFADERHDLADLRTSGAGRISAGGISSGVGETDRVLSSEMEQDR